MAPPPSNLRNSPMIFDLADSIHDTNEKTARKIHVVSVVLSITFFSHDSVTQPNFPLDLKSPLPPATPHSPCCVPMIFDGSSHFKKFHPTAQALSSWILLNRYPFISKLLNVTRRNQHGMSLSLSPLLKSFRRLMMKRS
jgi:hypothetical protein